MARKRTEQGFNIGKPPYGYQIVVEKHPVPAKAALGKAKRRLVRDPVRGPVVTQFYTWRVVEKLSYEEIADRLNLDAGRYPRRDRGVAGKVNPRGEWIWSSKPRHEPLTTKALFEAGTPIGKSKKGSRTSDQSNSHPATTRTYRLRSYVAG